MNQSISLIWLRALSLSITLLSIFPLKGQQPSLSGKYSTVGHRLLTKEKELALRGDASDREYRRDLRFLDGLIDATREKVERYVAFRSKPIDIRDSADAQLVLGWIDDVLYEARVIVCIKVELLSEGLRPLKKDGRRCFKYRHGYTMYPELDKKSNWRALDCDLSAIVHVSIGEVIGYPIHMVEVPGHNFVRWQLSDTTYINWDNNSRRAHTDDEYRAGKSATISKRFTKDDERRLRYLSNMTIAEIEGYYAVLLANALITEGRYAEAEELLEQAIAVCPYSALALNNLSWMYLTVPQMADPSRSRKALEYSEQVDNLAPGVANYMDTYACACAANAMFDRAIELEKAAFNDQERLAGYAQRRTCLDLGVK